VKKALAQAIEKKPGGIEWFKKEERKNQHDLEATLNADTATFGQRGDKLRGKTGQLFCKWKVCDRSKHLERVPNRCQVLLCEEQRKRGQSGSDSDPSVSEEEESGSDGGSGIPVSKQSESSAKKKESPPAVMTATRQKPRFLRTPAAKIIDHHPNLKLLSGSQASKNGLPHLARKLLLSHQW